MEVEYDADAGAVVVTDPALAAKAEAQIRAGGAGSVFGPWLRNEVMAALRAEADAERRRAEAARAAAKPRSLDDPLTPDEAAALAGLVALLDRAARGEEVPAADQTAADSRLRAAFAGRRAALEAAGLYPADPPAEGAER